jgi:putative phosphonate metabolism protein
MSVRYAIYFAPQRGSPWWTFGAHWLGRDECDGAELSQPLLEGIAPQELALLTGEPRRYGFHATLKAPFRLADGCDEAMLLERVHTLAQTLVPVRLGRMRMKSLGDFVALVPEAEVAGLQDLAASCVRALDDLRAPLSADDLIKRQPHTLDARGAELLALYGYPYVMERFRFHLTLTGPIESNAARRIEQAVASQVEHLNAVAPLSPDRLCVFAQRTPGAPFLRISDSMLQGLAE